MTTATAATPTSASPSLAILAAQFPGQVLIPLAHAARAAGFAVQTARNQLVRGKFPLPTTMLGNRRFAHIADLAEFLDAQRQPTNGTN